MNPDDWQHGPNRIGQSALRVGLGAGEVEQINAALNAAGLPPNEVQSAVQAYTGLDENCTNALVGIIDGGPVSLTTLAPLIGAGLAATGVGLPIVAAVSALLPILDGIIGAFASPPEHCTWKVGTICINAKQPYGPSDPRWVGFESFLTVWRAASYPTSPSWAAGRQALETAPCPTTFGILGMPLMDQAFSYYEETIGCELDRLTATPAPSLALPDQFKLAYYRAWQANAEFAINGYQSADPYALLQACALAWNRAHATNAQIILNPYSAGLPLATVGHCACSKQPPDMSYVGLLLNGDIDGKDHPPITLNAGGRQRIVKLLSNDQVLALRAANAKAATAWSTPTKVAVAAGGVAVAGAIGVGLWAAASHQAYGAAWGAIWKGITKPFR